MRHTSAMIVLHATQDIRKVSLWLGHSNLATTEIYTRGDPSEKLEAIEAIVPPHLRKGSFRPPDRQIVMESKGDYGLDCAERLAYLISQGDRQCSFRPNFPIPATTTKTQLALNSKRFAGPTVPIVRSEDRSIA
jgi:hypothetical protein